MNVHAVFVVFVMHGEMFFAVRVTWEMLVGLADLLLQHMVMLVLRRLVAEGMLLVRHFSRLNLSQ